MPTENENSVPVGVIGLGLLGRGIVASFLAAGFRVVAFDADEEVRRKARSHIEKALLEISRHAASTVITAAQSGLEHYTEGKSLACFEPCEFVVESVVEDFSTKIKVYDDLEKIVATDVPIGSNTSGLPISRLQRGRKNPQRFLGMHWADPAYGNRFLEIVRGEETSDITITKAVEIARALGKEPCLVQRDLPGFIVNRLNYAMYREAASLLEHGIADVETIDRSFRNACGLWATFCGPFRWIDITGGPALYAEVMKEIVPTLNGSPEVPAVFKQKQEENERGILNGRGFYSYGPADAEYWLNLYHEHIWEVRRLQDRYFPLPDEKPAKK